MRQWRRLEVGIIPELYLYATLRYLLAGGSYTDICVFCGISVTSFYSIVWNTIHAINNSILIEFPSTAKECANNAAQFEGINYREDDLTGMDIFTLKTKK